MMKNSNGTPDVVEVATPTRKTPLPAPPVPAAAALPPLPLPPAPAPPPEPEPIKPEFATLQKVAQHEAKLRYVLEHVYRLQQLRVTRSKKQWFDMFTTNAGLEDHRLMALSRMINGILEAGFIGEVRGDRDKLTHYELTPLGMKVLGNKQRPITAIAQPQAPRQLTLNDYQALMLRYAPRAKELADICAKMEGNAARRQELMTELATIDKDDEKLLATLHNDSIYRLLHQLEQLQKPVPVE